MAREIRLVTVGRTRNREFADSIQTYLDRASGWVKSSWQVVPAQGGAANSESRALLAALDGGKGTPPWVVLCDSTGEMVGSETLAHLLQGWLERPGGHVAVVVGGASGVDETVRRRAEWCWSLSRLTLPHGLAAVVVAEQLYRALSILEGHPYHTGH